MAQFRTSRRWIATTGPKRRTTTLTFVLPRAARVIFVVQQVSPVCRTAYRFTVKGHPGVNRIRFPGRASRLQLDPGTYRITAQTSSGGIVRKVTLVVVDGATATRGQIAVARSSNRCSAAGNLASAVGATGANTGSVSSSVSDDQRSATPSARGATLGSNTHSGAVLGSTVEEAAHAIRPLLVALLALAIVLLALASLPRVAFTESRANDLLMRHRTEIAGLGAFAFVAVVIAFLLG